MAIKVNELRPGDRVLLNCPKAKSAMKREAVFEGIFDTFEAAAKRGLLVAIGLDPVPTVNGRFARFLMEKRGVMELVGAFLVEDSGNLRETEGREIFIEARLRIGQG